MRTMTDDMDQDHILFGPAYRVNVITASALGDPAFAEQAAEDFVNKQEGILTNQGGDLLGMFFQIEKSFPFLVERAHIFPIGQLGRKFRNGNGRPFPTARSPHSPNSRPIGPKWNI